MSAVLDKVRRRQVQILGLIAGALSLMAFAFFLGGARPTETHDRLGKKVLPEFAAIRADASAIRVTLSDEAYTLVNTPKGWTLEGQGGYRVRTDRLNELATGLESLTWGAGRTRDPQKLNRVGLGDPRDGGTGALIEILDAKGAPVAALITGRKADYLYGRLPDDAQAYRVEGDLPPLYNTQAWLDLEILDINEDAISAVRLFDARGASLYLRRPVGQTRDGFRPAPPFQTYRIVSARVAATHALALTRFQPIGVKPAAALTTKPVARHITTTYDGLEVDLSAYREPDGFFVTLRAVEAGEGANRGAAINERAAGWAFELGDYDWAEFTPRLADIAQTP